jgi:hypothetical protein
MEAIASETPPPLAIERTPVISHKASKSSLLAHVSASLTVTNTNVDRVAARLDALSTALYSLSLPTLSRLAQTMDELVRMSDGRFGAVESSLAVSMASLSAYMSAGVSDERIEQLVTACLGDGVLPTGPSSASADRAADALARGQRDDIFLPPGKSFASEMVDPVLVRVLSTLIQRVRSALRSQATKLSDAMATQLAAVRDEATAATDAATAAAAAAGDEVRDRVAMVIRDELGAALVRADTATKALDAVRLEIVAELERVRHAADQLDLVSSALGLPSSSADGGADSDLSARELAEAIVDIKWYARQRRRVGAGSAERSEASRAVFAWLRSIGLEQYGDALLAAGFTSMSLVSAMSLPADLDEIGIVKLGHRKGFTAEVEKLRVLQPAAAEAAAARQRKREEEVQQVEAHLKAAPAKAAAAVAATRPVQSTPASTQPRQQAAAPAGRSLPRPAATSAATGRQGVAPPGGRGRGGRQLPRPARQ